MFEAVLRANPTAIVVFEGPELRVAWANEAYAELLSPPCDPTGRSFAELWPAEAAAGEVLRAVLATGVPARIEEHERRYADGRTRWFTMHAQLVPWDERGAVLSNLSDIGAVRAARLEAEEAAREAAESAMELDVAVSAMEDGLILCDGEGRLRIVNDAARRLLGIEQVHGGRLLLEELGAYVIEDARGERVRPEDLPIARALRGETVHGAELVVYHLGTDDPARWVSSSAAPIRRRDGEILGAVVTFTDVTPLRHVQEERADIVRTISHDLRTPLSVVSAQARLLARRACDAAEVERRANAIGRSVERMSAMLSELLSTIRVESGTAQLETAAVPLEPFLRELLERLRGVIPVDRIALEPGRAVVVRADPLALERIVVNLVTNAVKYSPADAPVTVRFRDDGSFACVDVEDRGPGIPKEEQHRVFDRFYRGATHATTEGLGLGLFITRLLATRLGGKIRLSSEPGRGSTFTVVLPVVAPAAGPGGGRGA